MSENNEASAPKRPSVHHRILTSSLRGQKGDAAIRASAAFEVTPGSQLSGNCRVGPLLGAGAQVHVLSQPCQLA